MLKFKNFDLRKAILELNQEIEEWKEILQYYNDDKKRSRVYKFEGWREVLQYNNNDKKRPEYTTLN